MSTNTVSNLERGMYRNPHGETVRLALEALGLSLPEQRHLARLARQPVAGSRQGTLRVPADLATPPTRLFGREALIERVMGLLGQDDVRLVTLTGTGGVGKTRVALEVAGRAAAVFADGVTVVSLAGARDADAVHMLIAQALDVREPPCGDSVRALVEHLEGLHTLLVLDNFEQVVDATSLVTDLLAACDGVRVLATSRTRLRLSYERPVRVTPLELPPATDIRAADLASYPATALFVERVDGWGPGWEIGDPIAPLIAEICIRLDGLPLALGLAAARARLLPPAALLARLARRLPLLTSGHRDAPARQQTLRRTLDWSFDLLGPHAQDVFRLLALFPGGATLEAAQAVCGSGVALLDALEELVDSCLVEVVVRAERAPRFMFLETTREYAEELLDRGGERDAALPRAVAYCQSLVNQARPRLTGPDQAHWLDVLEAEHDNLRAALRWAGSRGDVAAGLAIAAGLWRFWEARGYASEGLRWLEGLLEHAADVAPALRAQGCRAAGNLARDRGDAAATRYHEAALAAFGEAGDPHGIGTCLLNLGNLALDGDRNEEARQRYEAALAAFRTLGDPHHLALARNNLGIAMTRLGRHAEAIRLLRQARDGFRELGDRIGVARAYNNVGDVLAARGRHDQARRGYEVSLKGHADIGDRHGMVFCLQGLARIAAASGAPERAARLFGAAQALRADR